MRLLLIIVGALAAVACIEKPAEAQNYPCFRKTSGSFAMFAAILARFATPSGPSRRIRAFAGAACFADGVSEDIITELSRFSDLFVIARNRDQTMR